MSRRNGKSKTSKLELKLNLSPPAPQQRESPSYSTTGSTTSPSASCVSSDIFTYSCSPEATSSMVLVGCPRCFMYVMLSQDDPKCPKCKSSVLLDFFHESNYLTAAAANTTSTNNNKTW